MSPADDFLIFANSLDLDQAQQNVGPELDPNCESLILFLKEFSEKFNFEKNQQKAKLMVLIWIQTV